MKIQIRKILPESIAAVILIALSAYLLGGDVWTFWTWWLLALFMGMVAMPVTGRLFEGFEDKGWLFSKALAIAVTGFLTWFLVAVKLLPFTAATCIGVSVICGIFCAILFHVQLKKGIECYPSGKIQLIVREELLFFGIFSSLDLSGGIPSTGIWNREIYGLWIYGGDDAQQNTSCP